MQVKKLSFGLSTIAYLSIIPLSVITISQPTYADSFNRKSQSLTKESNAFISTKLSQTSFTIAQARSLTGVWNCNDGGVYFIRQVGNQMWWYGQSGDGGETWSNVFQGTIRGDEVTGSWADVPKGAIRGSGEMTLRLSGNRIEKISGGENFGGSVWSR